MSDPALSVIVPCFNNAATVGACVASLRALDAVDGDMEIIVVDNGSEDDSAAIVRSFDDVTLLSEDERGAYPARNTGLRAARAPVIAFTDADCTVDRDWARVLLDRFSEPRLGLLIGHVRFPEAASPLLKLLGAWENAKADYIARACPPANRIAYCNNMAVRAALFRELGPFSPWRRAGDSEFAQRVARERPDLGFAFEPALRVTHHEFTRARERLKRMRRYTQTNRQIRGFRELTLRQRLAALAHALRGGGRQARVEST